MRHLVQGTFGCLEVLFELLCELGGSPTNSGFGGGGFSASLLGPEGKKTLGAKGLLCCMPVLIEQRRCERGRNDSSSAFVQDLEAATGWIVASTESRLRAELYHADGEGRPVRTLAKFLTNLGQAEDCQSLWQRELEENEAKLGPKHPKTTEAAAALAVCLDDLGRAAEAEILHRKVYEATDHRRSPAVEAALAACLCAQGHASSLGVAAATVEQIDAGIQSLEGGPARALDMMLSKAARLEEKKTWKEAEHLYRQALSALRRCLGPYHPDTLHALNNLASCLGEQGKLREAEELLRRTVAGLEATLCSKNPRPLQALSNLACCLADQGRLKEAEDLHRRAFEACKRQLGGNHPETQACAEGLAAFLNAQGHCTEAALIVLQGDIRKTARFHET